MKKEIYLTFDMDWAIDEVLEYFYELIEEYQVAATLNVTHETPLLQNFECSRRVELGIHPNYNDLLNTRGVCSDCESVLENMKKIVPGAVCCRSHFLTTSSIIVKNYKKYGIKYELIM